MRNLSAFLQLLTFLTGHSIVVQRDISDVRTRGPIL